METSYDAINVARVGWVERSDAQHGDRRRNAVVGYRWRSTQPTRYQKRAASACHATI